MKHRHHIVPKHAGGTDDPSNLIELTVNEHAKAHYILWNQYGRWQDKLAWKALSKMIGKEKIIFSAQSWGSKELWKSLEHRKKISNLAKSQWENPLYRLNHSEKMKSLWKNQKWRESAIDRNRSFQLIAVEASLSNEARQKRKDSLKAIEHNKGPKNPMFGKMWVTNGIDSHRINKNDSIPEGYRKGRVLTTK